MRAWSMPPRACVTIGGHLFSAKKHAKEWYAQIRDGAPLSGDLTHDQEAFLLDCVVSHIKIKEWLGEHNGYIERVYVGAGAKAEYSSRSVCVNMRSSLDPVVAITETVGPDNCLAGLFGVKGCPDAAAIKARYWKQKREERARDAVKDDMADFRENKRRDVDGLFECAACERCVAKEYVVVDHVDPLFETILAEFLADHPECTLAHDDPLAIEWRVFHASKWRVQLLCKGCHYDKTAGETSNRVRKKREERAVMEKN